MSGAAPVPGRRNWWPWLPVIVFAAILPANLLAILVARHLRSGHADDHPYIASQHADQELAAQRAWGAGGWSLAGEPDPAGVRLLLSGPAVDGARILRYRPNDPGLDAEFAWSDPARPLEVPLPAPGAWELTLVAQGPAGAIRHRLTLDHPRPPEHP